MNSPSIQPIQFDDFSEISTATNERKLYLGSLNNLQAAKFEKKILPKEMRKMKSTLTMMTNNTSGSTADLQIYRYKIYCHMNEKDNPISIYICLPGETLVSEAVSECMKSFNEYFKENQIDFSLKNEDKKYGLFISKKNGKAKMDLPCLEDSQNISMTQMKCFCLCLKDEMDKKIDVFNQNETIVKSAERRERYSNSLISNKIKVEIEDKQMWEDCRKGGFCGLWGFCGKKST